jgi:hypothetical protein
LNTGTPLTISGSTVIGRSLNSFSSMTRFI